MNKPVSFELAKLLKEKEYQEKVNTKFGYCDGVEIDVFNTIFSDTYENFNLEFSERQKFINKNGIDELEEFSAPTIADVVMWLYEKHEIWINVERYSTLFRCYAEEIGDERFGKWEGHKYESPTEAYEVAIKYTLNYLL